MLHVQQAQRITNELKLLPAGCFSFLQTSCKSLSVTETEAQAPIYQIAPIDPIGTFSPLLPVCSIMHTERIGHQLHP